MSENEKLAEMLRMYADEECADIHSTRLREAATALTAAQARIRELEGALAAEREACAALVEDEMPATQDMESTLICEALERAASAIRARALKEAQP